MSTLPNSSTEQDLLQHVVDDRRSDLERAGQDPHAQAWLQQQLDSSEGTSRMFEMLSYQAEQPQFLQTLTEAQNNARQDTPNRQQGNEVLQDSWWQVPPQAQCTTGSGPAEEEGLAMHPLDEYTEVAGPSTAEQEDLHSYVVVERQDVLEAIGTFVAAYLATIPQAQDLPPKELQAAVARAFQELSKSKIRRLWEWGRCIYRCIAFSYGAFSVYENPWLVRAVLMALWTASKLLIRGFIPLIF
ncbi:hypothetical protein WJX74_004544 [Apatococcus lobatus]|uniref:Uncharacterized protein n=1 Tax=Apatococcus lobatus TaxID=904363 RepID=A0AAW1SAT6_9CHLO